MLEEFENFIPKFYYTAKNCENTASISQRTSVWYSNTLCSGPIASQNTGYNQCFNACSRIKLTVCTTIPVTFLSFLGNVLDAKA